MEISSSQVAMAARSTTVEIVEERERLQIWRADTGPGTTRGPRNDSAVAPGQRAWELASPQDSVFPFGQRVAAIARGLTDGLELSPEARALQPQPAVVDAEEASRLSPADELQFSLLKALIERLTGRRIELYRPNEVVPMEVSEVPTDDTAAPAPAWGMRYDSYQRRIESEQVSFAARGVVQTADGQQIEFEVSLRASREVVTESMTSISAGAAAIDPIVLNFNGNAVELGDTRFAFDLDADGREEQIAFLKPGSGFLALDDNGDGVINDGSELFGPRTGDGYAELARYDADGNQWIDEADPVFARLRIWSRDANGEDRLVALGDRNVGAIYLGHVATPMTLDAGRDVGGALRDTGLFLREDGGAGTVQQIDLMA